MIGLFWDEEHGGFYFTGHDAEALIVREKEVYDGAMPSGNSVAAVQLLRLGQVTGDLSLIEKAESMFSVFKPDIDAYPSGHAFFMQSVLKHLMPKKEIVIFGNADDPARKQIITALQKAFKPNDSILVAEHPDECTDIAPFAADYRIIDGKTTVYICENFACQQPTTNIEEAIQTLISSRD
ncbi:hypothetical protein [Bacillus inaquosorum]|nr:hypothetical protein [Bacillus inaquosorum]